MRTFIQQITDNLYAFLVWDESWNSYNNCYILIEENDVILIDSGKEEHGELLITAMNNIEMDKETNLKFIATHGHKDHIGGIQFFNNVEGWIHNNDLELLPARSQTKLYPELPDNGTTICNLDCVLLGHHTKGSVLLYHHRSKALFCGDHICFFGEQLEDNKVVEEGKTTRERYKKFVSDWSNSEEMRKKYNFDLFKEGLHKMNKFDIAYLCTGHGVVLKGAINEFITELLEGN